MSQTHYGIMAMIGIWLTGGIGFPLSTKLANFSVGQIMVGRGLMTLIFPLIQCGKRVFTPHWATVLAGAFVTAASYLTFTAFRVWAVNPVIVTYTLGAVMTILIARIRGRAVHREVYIACGIVLMGIVLALSPWRAGSFSGPGFLLALAAALSGSLFTEMLHISKDDFQVKCFWIGLGMLLLGAALSGSTLEKIAGDPHSIGTLLTFGFFIGYLNLVAGTKAIEYLSPEVFGTLVRGETIVMLIVSWLMLGEVLSPLQWVGVGIASYGAVRLGRWLGAQ